MFQGVDSDLMYRSPWHSENRVPRIDQLDRMLCRIEVALIEICDRLHESRDSTQRIPRGNRLQRSSSA